MSDERCPVKVSSGTWDGWKTCGRAVKRDGKCGIHAAAAEKRQRGDADRDQERERGTDLARRLTQRTGLRWSYGGYGQGVVCRLDLAAAESFLSAEPSP